MQLVPATRCLWHMARTRPGLHALVRSGALVSLLELQQRPLKQPLRIMLLELSCTLLDGVLTAMGSEDALRAATERRAWLAGAAAAREELAAARSPAASIASVWQSAAA